MASEGEFDLAQLSATQQEALQQYTQVTNQEITDAVPLLQRSQWNVQVDPQLLFLIYSRYRMAVIY